MTNIYDKPAVYTAYEGVWKNGELHGWRYSGLMPTENPPDGGCWGLVVERKKEDHFRCDACGKVVIRIETLIKEGWGADKPVVESSTTGYNWCKHAHQLWGS